MCGSCNWFNCIAYQRNYPRLKDMHEPSHCWGQIEATGYCVIMHGSEILNIKGCCKKSNKGDDNCPSRGHSADTGNYTTVHSKYHQIGSC